MAKFSLRRYEDQAKVSLAASLASVVTFLGLVSLVVRAIMKGGWSEMTPSYGPPAQLAILTATAVTGLISVIGFGLGINSVGQRRNEKQNLSWMGFFISAVVMVLTICVFAFFFFRGEKVR